MAERRPDFLKGPLLASLQNSEAYGFVSTQFTAQDFPAISKKSLRGSSGEISDGFSSDNGAKAGPGSPALTPWYLKHKSVRACAANVVTKL